MDDEQMVPSLYPATISLKSNNGIEHETSTTLPRMIAHRIETRNKRCSQKLASTSPNRRHAHGPHRTKNAYRVNSFPIRNTVGHPHDQTPKPRSHAEQIPVSDLLERCAFGSSGSGGRARPRVVLSLKNTAVPGASGAVRPLPLASTSHISRPPS